LSSSGCNRPSASNHWIITREASISRLRYTSVPVCEKLILAEPNMVEEETCCNTGIGEPEVSSFSGSKGTANSVPRVYISEVAFATRRSQITPESSPALQSFPAVIRHCHDVNFGVIKTDGGIFDREEDRFAARQDLRPPMRPFFSLKLCDRRGSAASGGNS
jgi:hypothetical protein